MAEPDHIFVNPLPNLSDGGYPAAFPFFYIKPDQNHKILRKFFPEEYGPVNNIDPIGNSPVIIRKVISLKIKTWIKINIAGRHNDIFLHNAKWMWKFMALLFY